MDVNRSLKRFPPGIGESERPALQEQLTRLIIRVIIAHPTLHYYQGLCSKKKSRRDRLDPYVMYVPCKELVFLTVKISKGNDYSTYVFIFICALLRAVRGCFEVLPQSFTYLIVGYHDVAITFLLVVGEELGFQIVERLSVSHLKDFMAPTMEETVKLLQYMYPIFRKRSPKLHQHLVDADLGTIFALPWLITWFGHVLPDYGDVVRLYDFFLAQPPMMPIYLAASIVIHREKEILATGINQHSMQMGVKK